MKHANLVRILIKLLGLYLVVQGVAGAAFAVVYSVLTFADSASFWSASEFAYPVGGAVSSGISLLLGVYLLAGAEAVVRVIMRGTGNMCPVCKYDLSGVTSDKCPECGAARG